MSGDIQSLPEAGGCRLYFIEKVLNWYVLETEQDKQYDACQAVLGLFLVVCWKYVGYRQDFIEAAAVSEEVQTYEAYCPLGNVKESLKQPNAAYFTGIREGQQGIHRV